MKKILCMCMMACLPLAMKAQDSSEGKEVKTAHLTFQGIPITGSIDDFKEKMEPRFKLKRKMGSENHYIFEGPLYGRNVLLQVYYTRKSRTPYRVVVSPKNMNILTLQDSLKANYGEPVLTETGLLWQKEEGIILHYTPEGYETALIYLDNQGNEVFRKEK